MDAIAYTAKTLSRLLAVPVRYYEDDDSYDIYSMKKFPVDPIALVGNFDGLEDRVGYAFDDHFSHYAVTYLNCRKLVFGPARETPFDEKELHDYAFRLGIDKEDFPDFVAAMRSINPLPFTTLVETACFTRFQLTGDRVRLDEVIIKDVPPPPRKQEEEGESDFNNSLEISEMIMGMVERGSFQELDRYAEQGNPALLVGVLAPEQLRHMKNTFVVTATLAARAAIRGGLQAKESLGLSDRYIQRMETLKDPGEVLDLQFRMVRDYAVRVDRIRRGKNPGPLLRKVANYVQQHLYERISTEKMAKDLFTSRTRLSADFKKETGIALSSYIRSEKIEEAKRLLRATDRSASSIASYLAFSSPAHFASVFKEVTGMTPSEYREGVSGK